MISKVAQETQDKLFTRYLVLKQKAPYVDTSHIDNMFTIVERFKGSDSTPCYHTSLLLIDISNALEELDSYSNCSTLTIS